MKKFNLFFLNLILIWNLSGQQLLTPEESVIGNTYYDLQTWRAMQNRIFRFDDGTIGAVWNMSLVGPGYNDRGVGYNYFNGNSWGIYPWQPITSGWAIFPSYTDYGENGEICISQGLTGLIINWRVNKGTGPWQQTTLPGANKKHPVVVTTGTNNEVVHILYLNADAGFIPTEPQPFRGFVWYTRSSDGMQTWDINQQIPGLGQDEYLGFTIGAYAWAEPKNDVLAFVAGDYLTDLVLMKSLDGGGTWQKTVIWEHPYPFLEFFSNNTDTFYCNNGGIAVALDNILHAHLTFGIGRVKSYAVVSPWWYFPWAGGLAYWTEGMPTFSNNINALNPYGHPDSELIEDFNLIAWLPDLNGNGLVDTIFITSYPTPGTITTPQITIGEQNEVFVVFCSITETYNNGIADYRHLWARIKYAENFWSQFFDINSDLIHIFDECVYPSMTSMEGSEVQLIYQTDNEPGLCIYGGNLLPCENNIWAMNLQIEYPPVYLSPNFYGSPLTIEENNSVFFYNTSTGNPDPNSFNWTFEGGTPATSILENPEIVYHEPGSYDVTLLVSNGVMTQTLTKENYITVLTGTGVKDSFKKNDILISPNPTNGKITVLVPGNNKTSIKVFNLLGKVILESHLQPVQKKINLELTGNPEGIYFVEINYGDQNCIKKVILKK
jgi:hypothetical protein